MYVYLDKNMVFFSHNSLLQVASDSKTSKGNNKKTPTRVTPVATAATASPSEAKRSAKGSTANKKGTKKTRAVTVPDDDELPSSSAPDHTGTKKAKKVTKATLKKEKKPAADSDTTSETSVPAPSST
jgi:hypothetical protein